MSYLRPFVKVTWGGSIGTQEIWATSFHIIFDNNPADPRVLLDSFPTELDAIVNLLRVQHNTINGPTSNVVMEWVKFAVIGTDGKYIGEPRTANITPTQGGYTEVNVSAYNGAAISLLGDIPRDPAGRGRFYPPANAVAAQDGYFIGADVQTRLAASWANVFRQVNTQLDNTATSARVGMVSEKGTGSQQDLVAVRVGSVLDVQRRRKNRIQETYVNNVL